MLSHLLPLAETLGQRLKDAGQTVAVAESSSGGLISAALLAVPGASAYFLGGAVVYTGKARMSLLGLTRESVAGMRSSSERGRRARTSTPTGAFPKPAPPAQPAIPMATPLAIPAWR